jgi:hypothetical protein
MLECSRAISMIGKSQARMLANKILNIKYDNNVLRIFDQQIY